jgi:hypothetical protein
LADSAIVAYGYDGWKGERLGRGSRRTASLHQFVAEIKDRFMKGEQPERDLPKVREMIDRPRIVTIEQAEDAKVQNDAHLSRQAKMFLCHRYSRKKLCEIGAQKATFVNCVGLPQMFLLP